jgi:hypothetical protein
VLDNVHATNIPAHSFTVSVLCDGPGCAKKSIFIGSGVGFIVNAFVTLVYVGLLDVPMVEGIIVVCVLCLRW